MTIISPSDKLMFKGVPYRPRFMGISRYEETKKIAKVNRPNDLLGLTIASLYEVRDNKVYLTGFTNLNGEDLLDEPVKLNISGMIILDEWMGKTGERDNFISVHDSLKSKIVYILEVSFDKVMRTSCVTAYDEPFNTQKEIQSSVTNSGIVGWRNTKPKEERETVCFSCYEPLSTEEHKLCKACGWMVCPECYTCGCDKGNQAYN